MKVILMLPKIELTKLDKWLNDNEKGLTDVIHGSEWVVGAYEVELKLIELGTRIEKLEDKVRLLGVGLSNEINYHRN